MPPRLHFKLQFILYQFIIFSVKGVLGLYRLYGCEYFILMACIYIIAEATKSEISIYKYVYNKPAVGHVIMIY